MATKSRGTEIRPYTQLPAFGLRYLNTAGDSGAQLIADVVSDIL